MHIKYSQEIKYFELSKLHVQDITLKLLSLLQSTKKALAYLFFRLDMDRLLVLLCKSTCFPSLL